jgi:hypothetical protein
MNRNILNTRCSSIVFNHRNEKLKVGIPVSIPVIVLDTKTNELFEYSSINEAARSFNIYPKAIWRKVQSKKLYLGRYQIVAKYNDNSLRGNNKKFVENKLNMITYIKYLFKLIKNNKILIFYILLSIIVISVLYVSIFRLMLICKDVYSEYVLNMFKIKANHLKYMLEYKLSLNRNMKVPIIIDLTNRLVHYNWEWKSEWFNGYKSLSFINTKLDIYQSIINNLTLDFTYYPSPIIERIDLNSAFNTLISNKVIIYEPINTNPLGIQNINSNRNSLILDTSDNGLYNRARNTELLNYQSNILYLLINKLSPSLY